MTDMRPHARKVRRSLLPRELLGGVPVTGLVFILVLVVVFLYVLEMHFMIAPIAVLYLVMRHLTGRDQWMIDIVIDNVSQPDALLP